MAATNNRATKINKLYQALKKSFKPMTPPERPLLETMLYACLLEDAPYEAADESLARLEQDYFDWNEVRVTTVTELRDVLRGLPDPAAAAVRLRKCLHSTFETHYTFDLEEQKKQNLGKAVETLEKLNGVSSFVIGYVVQHCLGGHLIAVDQAAMRLLQICDIVSPGEIEKGKAPGLERAVPKAKGIEFTSLLHQAAVALLLHPKDKSIWSLIHSVHPEAKPLEPKPAAAKKPEKKAPEAPVPTPSAKAGKPAAEEKPDAKKGAVKPTSDKPLPTKGSVEKSDKAAPTKTAAKPLAEKPAAEKTSEKHAVDKSGTKLPAKAPDKPTAVKPTPEKAKPAAEKTATTDKKKPEPDTKKPSAPVAKDEKKPATTPPAKADDKKGSAIKPLPTKPAAKTPPPPAKPAAAKPTAAKPPVTKPTAAKPPAAKPPTAKPPSGKPTPSKPNSAGGGKQASKQLTRRKPK